MVEYSLGRICKNIIKIKIKKPVSSSVTTPISKKINEKVADFRAEKRYSIRREKYDPYIPNNQIRDSEFKERQNRLYGAWDEVFGNNNQTPQDNQSQLQQLKLVYNIPNHFNQTIDRLLPGIFQMK